MTCSTEGCYNEALDQRTLCAKCKSRKWRKNNPLKAAYTALRDNAKRRKKGFSLTFEQFKQFAKKVEFQRRGIKKESYHIDRIDETRGYHADNIQFIPNYINIKKYHEHRRYYTEYEDTRVGESQNCPF